MSQPAAPVQAPPPAVFAQNTVRYSQQPAPFLPQGYQTVNMPEPARFQTTRTFALGKIVLGAFNLVFAIITLGLAIRMCVGWLDNGSAIAAIIVACVVRLLSCTTLNLVPLVLSLPFLCEWSSGKKKKNINVPPTHQAFVSFAWQFADGLTLLIRRSIHRPIHPGAHVGVHLILWIISILAVGSLAVSLADILSYWSVASNDLYCDSYNYYNDYDDTSYLYCGFDTFSSAADAKNYMSLLEALVAFSVLLLATEFTLFVLACIETDRRRKYGKMTKVVYVMAPAPGQMTEGGMMPAPQHYSGVAPPQPVYA